MDGKWHRERVEGDRGHAKAGRYKAYADGLPAGFLQNFKRGEGVRWHADRPTQPMTDAERQQLAASRVAREREQAEALRAATAKAQSRWVAGVRVKQHPYLRSKGISADAETFRRDRRGNLMTAMVDGTGLVRNVQTIAPDGQKRFVPGAQVSGLFSLMGKIQQDWPIMIAEGVATAKTMHEATGLAVVTAYSAGNLGPVSKVIAEIASSSRLRCPTLAIPSSFKSSPVRRGRISPSTELSRNAASYSPRPKSRSQAPTSMREPSVTSLPLSAR